MGPQHQTHLPPGFVLAPMPASQPQHDERPVLRDREGRVLAVVDRWTPPDMPN